MSDERFNHALDKKLYALPGDFYLLNGIADSWTVLYPAPVVAAIGAAYADRLQREKSEHMRTIDREEHLKERVAILLRENERLTNELRSRKRKS